MLEMGKGKCIETILYNKKIELRRTRTRARKTRTR